MKSINYVMSLTPLHWQGRRDDQMSNLVMGVYRWALRLIGVIRRPVRWLAGVITLQVFSNKTVDSKTHGSTLGKDACGDESPINKLGTRQLFVFTFEILGAKLIKHNPFRFVLSSCILIWQARIQGWRTIHLPTIRPSAILHLVPHRPWCLYQPISIHDVPYNNHPTAGHLIHLSRALSSMAMPQHNRYRPWDQSSS